MDKTKIPYIDRINIDKIIIAFLFGRLKSFWIKNNVPNDDIVADLDLFIDKVKQKGMYNRTSIILSDGTHDEFFETLANMGEDRHNKNLFSTLGVVRENVLELFSGNIWASNTVDISEV